MAARSPAFRRGEDDDDEEDDDGSSVGSSHSARAAVFSSTVSDSAEAGRALTAAVSEAATVGATDAAVGSESAGARSVEVGREAAAGGAGAGSGPLAPSAFREGSDALSVALLETIRPPLAAISGRLVELQEAQQMLVTTLGVQRAELTEANSDWATAKSVLDRIPGAFEFTHLSTTPVLLCRRMHGLHHQAPSEAAAEAQPHVLCCHQGPLCVFRPNCVCSAAPCVLYPSSILSRSLPLPLSLCRVHGQGGAPAEEHGGRRGGGRQGAEGRGGLEGEG